jgi:transcriptional regulator with XRE-family HTH domain
MVKRTVTKSDKLVAGNIKRLRELYSISRRELEEKAGIAYGILDQIEALHKPAGKTIQKRITDALRCPLSELYRETGPDKVMEPAAPYLTKRQKRLLESAERLTDRQLEEVLDYMAWLLARKGLSQKSKKKQS